MSRIAEFKCQDTLLGRRAEFPGCPGVFVADRISAADVVVTRGDVVVFEGALGIVTAGFQEADGTIGIIVETADVRERLSPHTVVARPTGRMEAWVAVRIFLCLAWKPLAADLQVICE